MLVVIEEIFDNLLSGLDDQGQEEFDADWETRVSVSLESLRAAYEGLTVQNRDPIDYTDLATQAAYVFVYAIGRAEFTYQLLKRYRAVLGEPIFRKNEARITSLGGGPGSEIAGVVKYLLDPESQENVSSIKYWVFDKDGEWENICQSVVDDLSQFMPIELEYDSLDLCDGLECGKISLAGDDLRILSFVISELCALSKKSQAAESLRQLYKTLDDGARIFYNDSNASSFYYFFNETKTYVKGLGRVSEVSEIKERISACFNFGETYEEYIEEFEVTPHLTSDALSKFHVRRL